MSPALLFMHGAYICDVRGNQSIASPSGQPPWEITRQSRKTHCAKMKSEFSRAARKRTVSSDGTEVYFNKFA